MVPYAKNPTVTIQKRGTISLTASAFVLLGKPEAVELLYDSDEQIVGIRPVDRNVEHAYPLRGMGSKKDDTTYMLSGMAFTKYYGIDTSVARRYAATLEDGILCIDLKTEGTVVIGHRSKRVADDVEDANDSDVIDDAADSDDAAPPTTAT